MTSNSIKQLPYIVKFACTLLALYLIVVIIHATETVLVPLLFSILIAISLFPMARFMEKRLRFGKALAAGVAVVISIVILGALLWFIVNQSINIGRDASAIQEKIMNMLESCSNYLHDRFGIEQSDIVKKLREEGTKLMNNAGVYATAFFGSLGGILTNFIMIPLYSFFLLYYRDFFREFFFKAFKKTPNEIVNNVLNKIYYVVQSYLVGLITVMGIVAVLNTVGLMVMGIEYAWFFGSLASLLMLLPYIGITIGSILPAVFALATKDSYWYAIGVVGWFQVVQFLEGNIITPNITGSKVSINPLMSILAIILGGMLLGFSGLILALPLVAVLKVLFDSMESTEAFGFVIGEPEEEHLKRNSTHKFLAKFGIKMPGINSTKEKETATNKEENSETQNNQGLENTEN